MAGDTDVGARHSTSNWWGTDHEYADPTDTPETNPGVGGMWRPDPNDRHRIIADRLLRETGTLLCATTLYDRPAPESTSTIAQLFAWLEGEPIGDVDGTMHKENRPIELSDPELRLPQDDGLGTAPHARRINPEHGYISGDSTATIVQDRPLDELMDVVEVFFGLEEISSIESEQTSATTFGE